MTPSRPAVFASFPDLVAAQSTRHGGVSGPPYASLNLGLASGDVRENVLENRRLYFSGLGFGAGQVALSAQVHADRILNAVQPGDYEGYDALMTDRPGLLVGVSVADCTPVLVHDARSGAVAAIHAGWKGTALQIVAKTLQAMREAFGTRPADCFAYVGTCISECAFEVDADVADRFEAAYKRFEEETQKYFVDLKRANAAQVFAFGVPEGQVEVSPHCTVAHNADYFSYRREGPRSGRMMAVIGRR